MPGTREDQEPVFALIIGNNEYKAREHFKSLSYAVADADAIEALLIASLGLRQEHTVSKRNATRQEILDGFDELEELTKGVSNPCIIIFYAGHGAQAPRPEEWKDYTTDYDKIEVLCPSDIGVEQDDGQVVEGIPDKVIGARLGRLARTRGNNITLILDCCHSASLNRDEETRGTSRRLLNPPPVTAKANAISFTNGDPEVTRGVGFATGFGSHSSTSHILLAACGRDMTAYENHEEKHGYFTSALIKFLGNRKRNLEAETPLSLIANLRMPAWQVPHCTGANRSRPLFKHQGTPSDVSYIQCDTVGPPGAEKVCTLFAGKVEGIVPNDLFYVYQTAPFRGQENPKGPFGQMIAADVGHTSTVLRRVSGQFNIPKTFYAKKIIWIDAPGTIHCADQDLLKSISTDIRSRTMLKTGLVEPAQVVDEPTQASLVLTVEGDKVYLDRNDPLLNAYLPSRFPYTLDRGAPEKIQRVIGGWRHFHYHLQRGPDGEDDFPQIHMELHYLEPKNGTWDDDTAEYRPVGPNLLDGESVYEIAVSDEQIGRPLGFTLYNDGDVDVYPYLFYFDPTELTIIPWLLVAAGKGITDPPLAKHSRLAVGYGNGGAEPLHIFFEEGKSQDFGIFKLFITCAPANLRSMSQSESPFHLDGRSEDGEEEATRIQVQREEELKRMYANKWGVKTAAVVQVKR